MRTALLTLLTLSCAAPTEEPVAWTAATSHSGSSLDIPANPPPYTMQGFSFVDEHASGLPQPGRLAPLEDDLLFLAEQQIAILVSLTVTPTDPDAVMAAGLLPVHLPIEDFHAPTLEQQLDFVEGMNAAIERGQKVAVHCTAGLGRTGTLLATWFVAKGLDAQQAIEQIRALRPGSIETAEQETSVYDFAALWLDAR